MNRLYYGDNLEVLRGFPDASVDLIYLDPPFNSNAGYNVLFKSASGAGADASIEAFDDTWTWGEASKNALLDIAAGTNRPLQVMMEAMRTGIGENPLMAYLAMMAVRLVELHRVLKDTGSLYLHCDPTASHYLKLVLDAVFGPENSRNEIIWRRYNRPKGSQFTARKFGTATDTIFFYSKTSEYHFDLNAIRPPLSEAQLQAMYPLEDEKGRFMSGPMLRSASMGARPNLVFEYNGFTPGAAGWRMTKEKVAALDADGDIYWTATGQPKGMREEANSHPLIEMQFGGDSTGGQRFPALQIVTLAELFQGIKPKLPPLINPVKKASRVETRASHQKGAQGALL